jgi:hypothetical protein
MMEFYENNELKRIWKKLVMALFHIRQQLLGKTEENQAKNLSHDSWCPGGFSNTEAPNCKPQT